MFEPPYRVKNMMPGMIMLWNSAFGAVPSGWHECNGLMGTPDLRGKFVIGAAPGYPSGSTGGSASHTHPFTGDGHAHGIPNTLACPGAAANLCLNGTETDSEPAIGTTDSESNIPPYYSLMYIMKL